MLVLAEPQPGSRGSAAPGASWVAFDARSGSGAAPDSATARSAAAAGGTDSFAAAFASGVSLQSGSQSDATEGFTPRADGFGGTSAFGQPSDSYPEGTSVNGGAPATQFDSSWDGPDGGYSNEEDEYGTRKKRPLSKAADERHEWVL